MVVTVRRSGCKVRKRKEGLQRDVAWIVDFLFKKLELVDRRLTVPVITRASRRHVSTRSEGAE
jgi:hypothetical protein